MTKKIQSQESEVVPINTTGNGLHRASQAEKQGERSRANQETSHKATGPRTELGKKRSSKNAIKHGVFSKETLVKGESPTEYQRMLGELLVSLRAEGKIEELLVGKLMSISWRYRRLLIAEGAEIQRNTEFPEEISENWQYQVVKLMSSKSRSLIRNAHESKGLELCIAVLTTLREGIRVSGFSEERDKSLLTAIYGGLENAGFEDKLYSEYLSLLETARVPEDVRAQAGCETPEQCKQRVLWAIDAEIVRLKQDYKKFESIKAERRQIELLRQRVPTSPGLDRLLRYEASIDRAFGRTLAELERVQRMRKGQPLPPQLDVNIS